MKKWSMLVALVLGLAVPSLAFAASSGAPEEGGFCCPCCCD